MDWELISTMTTLDGNMVSGTFSAATAYTSSGRPNTKKMKSTPITRSFSGKLDKLDKKKVKISKSRKLVIKGKL